MGLQYIDFVQKQSDVGHWASVTHILDFEGDRDLVSEGDMTLAQEAIQNLEALAEEAAEVAELLRSGFPEAAQRRKK